jgi:hypothetical protein
MHVCTRSALHTYLYGEIYRTCKYLFYSDGRVGQGQAPQFRCFWFFVDIVRTWTLAIAHHSDNFRFQISNFHRTVAKLIFFALTQLLAPLVVTNFEFEFSNDIVLKTS